MDIERTDVSVTTARNIKKNVAKQGDVNINNAYTFYFPKWRPA